MLSYKVQPEKNGPSLAVIWKWTFSSEAEQTFTLGFVLEHAKGFLKKKKE